MTKVQNSTRVDLPKSLQMS